MTHKTFQNELRAVPTIAAQPADSVARLRTPYHSLGGDDAMRVPTWAERRSVYRASGRTLYLVETDSLVDARDDLALLNRAGWQVQIDEDPATSRARIAFTRPEYARAA